jgi:hypothetical protein
MSVKLLGIISVGSVVIDLLLIRFSTRAVCRVLGLALLL